MKMRRLFPERFKWRMNDRLPGQTLKRKKWIYASIVLTCAVFDVLILFILGKAIPLLVDAAPYLPKEYAQAYTHVTTLRDESRPRLRDEINAIAFSPDGQTLAAGGHRKILIWNVNSGTLITTLKVDKGWTNAVAVAFSSDGKTLASVSSRPRKIMEQGILVDPSMPMQEEWGQYFVPHTVRLWNVNTGSTRLTFTADTLPIIGLEFSPDSAKLLTVSQQGFVGVYDNVTGHHEHLSGSVHVYNAIGRIHTLDAWMFQERRETFAVAFSTDRKIFAVGKQAAVTQLCDVADAEVELWDADTGYPLHTFKRPGEPINLLTFSPDSKTLASVSGSWSRRNDGRNTIFIWDVENRRLITTINVGDVGERGVLTLKFAPDSITLASAHVDGTVHLWDITGRVKKGKHMIENEGRKELKQ